MVRTDFFSTLAAASNLTLSSLQLDRKISRPLATGNSTRLCWNQECCYWNTCYYLSAYIGFEKIVDTMRLSALLLLCGSGLVQAWMPSLQAHRSLTALELSTTVSSDSYTKPERIIMDDLPTVYVYDHCPFCVRVRLALGIKNVKHNIYFMANDDVPTPSSLVGKKIAPIFEFPQDALIMAESMDIIELIDSDERFGPPGALKPGSGRTDLKEWQKSVQSLLRTLQRPRYVATGLLPEFQQLDARQAFIFKHQLPPYDKPEWKDMEMNDKLKIYAEVMSNDPVPMIEELSAKLVELDDIIFSETHCTEGGLSLDDIDLWARLRSISIIKGVVWPTKLRKYMDYLSELGDIPLYDELAL